MLPPAEERRSANSNIDCYGTRWAELTLMLDGSYRDVTGVYSRGDVQDVDEAVEHQPVVGTDKDCICLIASVHPARFKSLLGRITQPWTGL
jgi:putative transcriptional regulator